MTEVKAPQILQEISSDRLADVFAVRQEDNAGAPILLTWAVKEHTLSAQLLSQFHFGRPASTQESTFLKEVRTVGDKVYFFFPYEEMRPLKRFYESVATSDTLRAKLLRSIVALCSTADLPTALLYEIITQDRIVVLPDASVRFNFAITLPESFSHTEESEAAEACARLLIELLDEGSEEERAKKELLEKRLFRGGYRSFVELYRDVRMLTEDTGKRRENPVVYVKKELFRREDFFFRLFFTLTCIVLAVSLFILLSQAITGKIPLFNLFTRSFTRIGTESLVD